MAWHLTSDKPSPESMMTQFADVYMCRPAQWITIIYDILDCNLPGSSQEYYGVTLYWICVLNFKCEYL